MTLIVMLYKIILEMTLLYILILAHFDPCQMPVCYNKLMNGNWQFKAMRNSLNSHFFLKLDGIEI